MWMALFYKVLSFLHSKLCRRASSSHHLSHSAPVFLSTSQVTASWRGCRWKAPVLQLTAARSHIGGWLWHSPGRGCAPPWRWCGCSHRWRRRCSTPPTRRPPPPSWWGRPLRVRLWPTCRLISCVSALLLCRERRGRHSLQRVGWLELNFTFSSQFWTCS